MSGAFERMTLTATVWIEGDPNLFVPTLRALRHAHPDLEINVPWPGTGLPGELGLETVMATDPSTMVEAVAQSWERHVLLITNPVIVPPGLLDLAFPALDDDLPLGSISFLSNAAGGLSVPVRNQPTVHQVGVEHRECPDRSRRSRVAAPNRCTVERTYDRCRR